MLFTTILASVIAVAPIGQQDLSPKQCQERLAGTWEAHLTPQLSIHMVIEGDNIALYSVDNNGKSLAWSGKVLVEESAPMRHLDWKQRTSTNGPLPDNQCLYRIAGETLLLIGGGPDQRPTKFLSGHGNEPKTLVFTRVPTDG